MRPKTDAPSSSYVEQFPRECEQCDEHRPATVCGICAECYSAALALGFTPSEIAKRDPSHGF